MAEPALEGRLSRRELLLLRRAVREDIKDAMEFYPFYVVKRDLTEGYGILLAEGQSIGKTPEELEDNFVSYLKGDALMARPHIASYCERHHVRPPMGPRVGPALRPAA